MEPNSVDDDRCANLRWQGIFVDAPRDPTVQRSNDRSFWCLHTQNCLGPDGKVADEYECNETRGCFEPL